MKVALYARVSTTDQDPDNQLLQLRQYCLKQDFTVYQEYEDYISGSKSGSQRPGFKQMMLDAGKKKFQLLVFWSLDRFSREGAMQGIMDLQKLNQLGVGFRSLQEPYLDTLGPFADVVISIMFTLAKVERERHLDRVKAGISRAKLKGTKSGLPFGRPSTSDSLLTEIKRMKDQGMSDRAVGKTLGISHRTVAKYFQAPNLKNDNID